MERGQSRRAYPVLQSIASDGEPFDSQPVSDERADYGDQDHHYQAELRTTTFCEGTLHLLFKERDFTDVIFICEDGANVQAHKFILASRSEFFKELLYRRGDNLEENTKIKTYNFSATKIVLDIIIEYLYTGQVAEFETNGGVIEEHKERLWTSVLRQALSKSLGGLDVYLRALLVRCQTTEHHVAATLLAFAMDLDPPLMDVAQAMVQVLLELPFTEDCLKQLPEKHLEVVLDTVPFRVDETQICRALAQWMRAESIEDDDELGGSTLPPALVQRIDLAAISAQDLLDVVGPTGILDDKTTTEAYIMHATRERDAPPIETCVNTARGARYNWSSYQSSPLCDDDSARAILSRLQQYTTFGGHTCADGEDENGRNLNVIAE